MKLKRDEDLNYFGEDIQELTMVYAGKFSFRCCDKFILSHKQGDLYYEILTKLKKEILLHQCKNKEYAYVKKRTGRQRT